MNFRKNQERTGFHNCLTILKNENFQIDEIENQAQKIVKGTKNGWDYRVITLNLQILRLASESEDFYKMIKSSNFWIADGWPIVSFLKILKIDAIRRAGSDLVSHLLSLKETENIKIGFIGGNEQLIEIINDFDKSSQNKLILLSMDQFSIPLNNFVKNYLISQIRKFQIEIVLVSVGSPKQDFIISNLRESINGITYIPCGSALEFHYGTKIRAPIFVQKLNLEWFWRILMEPARLIPRYYKDIKFFLKFISFLIRKSKII